MLGALALVACGADSAEVEGSYAELPLGDPVNGEELYNMSVELAPACSNCHMVEGDDLGGPSLEGYANIAGERVEGQSAGEYTYQAIIAVDDYLTPGWNNVMYSRYGSRLTDQDIADITAYLLTLE